MSALILVDLQNDFFPGGALAVSEGDQILPAINELLNKPFDMILATKDFHPPHHISFASQHNKKPGDFIIYRSIEQILWPDHCVQNTFGSEFHSGWDSSKVQKIFYKGTDPEIDSYSTFFDNGHLKSTGLGDYLREHQILHVYLAGLATDYCVKYSALDAAEQNFSVYVIKEGCKGVNLNTEDSARAFEDMQKAGVKIIELTNIKLPGKN